MVVEDGDVICNECGKSLIDVVTHIDHMLRKRMDTPEKRKAKMVEMEEAAKPMIKYLAQNHHPHTTAIVTATGVEIVDGVMSNPNITEFLRD